MCSQQTLLSEVIDVEEAHDAPEYDPDQCEVLTEVFHYQCCPGEIGTTDFEYRYYPHHKYRESMCMIKRAISPASLLFDFRPETKSLANFEEYYRVEFQGWW